MKLDELVPERDPIVTDTAPVVAPAGTDVVMLVEVEAVTVAVVPLKDTILSAGVVLNPEPVIVTEVPAVPLDGDNKSTWGRNSANGRDHRPAEVSPAKRFVPLTAKPIVDVIGGKPVLTSVQFVPLLVEANTPLPAPMKRVVPFNIIE